MAEFTDGKRLKRQRRKREEDPEFRGKRKGKRKGGTSNPNNACSQHQLSMFNGVGYDYDDMDDPYGAFGYRGEGNWG